MLHLKNVLNINKVLYMLSAVLVLTHIDIYIYLICPFWSPMIVYIHLVIGWTSIDFYFYCRYFIENLFKIILDV